MSTSPNDGGQTGPVGAGEAGLSREQMLARIRGSLDADRSTDPKPPEISGAIARRIEHGEDLARLFCTNAEGLGMTVLKVHSAGLSASLVESLRAHNARAVSVACADELFASIASGAGGEVGADLVKANPGEGFDPHYAADVGITDVEFGVAETGSFVHSPAKGRGRGAALVPPVHYAIVPASCIVADLLDVWGATQKQNLVGGRSSVVLISGPSKTGDIEGVLVTGVHGPGEVHLFVVEDR